MDFKYVLRATAAISCLLPALASAVTVVPIAVTGGISFENPTWLNKVVNSEIQVGSTLGLGDVIHYDGTIAGLSPETTLTGKASSNISLWLPYFRVAQRFSDKWVLSLDVTQPLFGYADYKPDSLMRDRTNYIRLETYEIAPRFSYQWTPKFAVGGSFRLVHATQDLNFGFPIEFGGLYATQHSEGYAFGWSAAGSYNFSDTDILSLVYFSRNDINTSGFSAAGPYSSSKYKTTITEPGEFDLDYFHAFNQQWMATLKVIYAQWDVVKNTELDGVAGIGNLIYPADLNNGLALQLAFMYAQTEKVMWFLGGGYATQVVPEANEDPGFPNYPFYALAAGARFQMNKNLAFQPSVGYGGSSGNIHNATGDVGHYSEGSSFITFSLIATM